MPWTVLAILMLAAVPAVLLAAGPGRSARVLEVRRIWDRARHNAFTDLIRFKDRWLCTFREGAGHVSHDGKIRVIASADGKQWTSAALLTAPGVAILRVPLEEAELVQRAVAMPHQLARRFEEDAVELAMRADPRFLVEAGLDGYQVSSWRSGGGDGDG